LKKFIFPLQSILDIKESMEKEQKNQLAMIRKQLLAVRDELDALLAKKEWYMSLYREKCLQGTPVQELMDYMEYFPVLEEYIDQKRKELAELEKEEEKRRLKVIETMKEKKMLQTLKDKQYELYMAESAAEEDKRLDDFISYRWSPGSVAEV